jgi:hypothetical protein
MPPGLHAFPMKSGRGEILAAARPPSIIYNVTRQLEVVIARATIHLVRAYDLLEALDWRADYFAALPRFGALDCAIRNICLALIVLADDEDGCDPDSTPYPQDKLYE